MFSFNFFNKKTKHDNKTLFKKEFYCLGTINRLTAYGENCENAVMEAEQRLAEIDDKMSVFKDYSELSRINKSAGKNYEKVSEDTYFVIKSSIEYCNLLKGTFDPTIKPVVKLWNVGKENFRIPKQSEIDNALKLVNYKDILFDDENCSIMLKNENQNVDAGGIAKGYAADEVKRIFKRNEITRGIIDLGGNIFALGGKDDESPWSIGLQDPFSKRGDYIGIILVRNKSLVTSGNYERYTIANGKKYHHIIDPRTGYPSKSGLMSATIVSNLSIDGDGFSTGIFILGLKEGMELINSTYGIEGIFITENKEIYVSSGIKDKFILTNQEFVSKE
ncbi:FAD:protein FMN transferase [Clostridium sp. JN-9]|uniref:FAD:protein FMN transferase n=1 Tax=Clostridium sp. JN-9 TaxID=2507159 RepID=UPI000FFE2A5F|nr:FAD:protein FMN transferase [Clostridium sp. JN-9]QAT40597.1 FAD:protein FMN transferase [Clostridium sp. JN-9]